MYYHETDTPAMARTSNLNEELGQVRAIECGMMAANDVKNQLLDLCSTFRSMLAVCEQGLKIHSDKLLDPFLSECRQAF